MTTIEKKVEGNQLLREALVAYVCPIKSKREEGIARLHDWCRENGSLGNEIAQKFQINVNRINKTYFL